VKSRTFKIPPRLAGPLSALPFAAALPAVARMLAIRFVDQRYQTLVMPEKLPEWAYPVAVLLLAAAYCAGFMLLKKRGGNAATPAAGLLTAALPLVLLAPYWYFPLTYLGLIFGIFCFALAAGRLFARLPQVPTPGDDAARERRQLPLLGGLILLGAAWGAFQQYRSHTLLGMQWLDWGHYYEALLNTWRGRFFHLNLSHGCFLGSRFCPSLLILSPVLLTGVPGFFFAGALAVASGALPVYLVARRFGASAAEALLFGVWYLVLPGVVNLELPLLDGFHEVFLLFPAVLWALWAYVTKRRKLAWALVLFSFGVRETIPFMFLGFGITLILTGRRRDGVLLAAASLAALVLILGVLMPLARPAGTVYDHVTFYPHLGSTIREIALSPLTRPRAFWGAVASAHSWRYYAALLLPFLFLAPAAPAWWLPMLCDLAMVAADRRFDSQTLLRHYQCVMLLTLVAAALEGFRRMRENGTPRWFRRLFGAADPVGGVLAATLAATLGMTLFFTQVPGLPGSDPRLGRWSDARPRLAKFLRHIEPGAEVTAGPRLAGFLVGRNEVFLSADAREPLKRYVLIEGLVPDYRQMRLRRRLLGDPGWTLLGSEYLDDRLIQLFEHKPRTAPLEHGVRKLAAAEWAKCGQTVPFLVPGVEVRGRVERGLLILAARIGDAGFPPELDLGFALRIVYHDAPPTEAFVTFGNGMLPAGMAAPGDVYTFAVPLAGRVKSCVVDPVGIGGAGQEF